MSMKIFTYRIFLSLCALLFSNQVLADYTVIDGQIIDASFITGQSGVLIVNGTLNVSSKNVVLNNFTSVIINGPNGKIFWIDNVDLSFPTLQFLISLVPV